MIQPVCVLQDSSQTSQWHVPATTVTLVGRMLKPGEDEVAQVSPTCDCLTPVHVSVPGLCPFHVHAELDACITSIDSSDICDSSSSSHILQTSMDDFWIKLMRLCMLLMYGGSMLTSAATCCCALWL